MQQYRRYIQETLGTELPAAYALDGYAIYGLTERDGTSPGGLDPFNGHAAQFLGYHYHSTTDYPYLNGGYHGEVVEFEGQVDPQPRIGPRPTGGGNPTRYEQPGGMGMGL